jgi:hypothetical protein
MFQLFLVSDSCVLSSACLRCSHSVASVVVIVVVIFFVVRCGSSCVLRVSHQLDTRARCFWLAALLNDCLDRRRSGTSCFGFSEKRVFTLCPYGLDGFSDGVEFIYQLRCVADLCPLMALTSIHVVGCLGLKNLLMLLYLMIVLCVCFMVCHAWV